MSGLQQGIGCIAIASCCHLHLLSLVSSLRKGVLIMRRKPIAKHYLHTWFAFDVIVVLIDWAAASANKICVPKFEQRNYGCPGVL